MAPWQNRLQASARTDQIARPLDGPAIRRPIAHGEPSRARAAGRSPHGGCSPHVRDPRSWPVRRPCMPGRGQGGLGAGRSRWRVSCAGCPCAVAQAGAARLEERISQAGTGGARTRQGICSGSTGCEKGARRSRRRAPMTRAYFANSSRSWFRRSLCVSVMPWGPPAYSINLAPLTSLTVARAVVSMGTI